MEEPFETILRFRYTGQKEDCAPLWWRLGKDRRPRPFPEELGIAPQNVLLLYEIS
jgi:molybdate transport system ATP-binding protein